MARRNVCAGVPWHLTCISAPQQMESAERWVALLFGSINTFFGRIHCRCGGVCMNGLSKSTLELDDASHQSDG